MVLTCFVDLICLSFTMDLEASCIIILIFFSLAPTIKSYYTNHKTQDTLSLFKVNRVGLEEGNVLVYGLLRH